MTKDKSEQAIFTKQSVPSIIKSPLFFKKIEEHYANMFIRTELKFGHPNFLWFCEKLSKTYSNECDFLKDPKEVANIICLVKYAQKYKRDIDFWWPTFLMNYYKDTRINGINLDNIPAITYHVDRLYR